MKAPFTISVTVPEPLTAVASGEPSGDPESSGNFRTFRYEQKVPVMSYLIAIVVAHLESCQIGPRSKCYAEPGVIHAAQKEFQDIVEDFILKAQEVAGGAKYEWGSYNVAVMPSSFAYGGMENPNCTFMSASLIPGDRSLTPTLAHEIVHSWIGNLVTNAFWKDFWLNEGFTRYIERRVLGSLPKKGWNSLSRQQRILLFLLCSCISMYFLSPFPTCPSLFSFPECVAKGSRLTLGVWG